MTAGRGKVLDKTDEDLDDYDEDSDSHDEEGLGDRNQDKEPTLSNPEFTR